jgi:O-antigen/teichoic acid export membrane protein
MNEEPIRKSNILSTSHKFAKNSIYNVMGFVVIFPILILLTPYMLKVLGNAEFGIWAIAGVVTSYAQLSDMGMTTAIVKFVAEHWAKRDVERISKVASTAFFSFAVVGGAVVAAILLSSKFIVINLLKVPAEMQSEGLFVVFGVVIIFYFNLLFSVYNSVLIGLQRMDVTNIIMTSSKVLRALGMWFFLAAGFGLKGLIWNGAIFSALTIGANAFYAKRLTRGLKVNPFLFSFAELRRVVKYSVNIFFATLMGLGQDPLNKIILASFTSLSFVSFYEIGNRVKDILRQLFQVGLMPLLPASSELRSVSNKYELERIYLSTSRILYMFAIPAFLLVIVLAEPLVQVWLGDGYTFAARAIQFLLLGNLFSLLITPQYIILNGIGKPQLSTLVSAVNGFSNIIIA